MANITGHPAPGMAKLPPGFLAVRGMGDIVTTQGFAVPDRDMRSADVTMGIGDILATQGFAVPDREAACASARSSRRRPRRTRAC